MQGSYYIFEYVCQLDVERSRKSGVPEQDYSDMPEAFSNVSAESLGGYMKAQFHYWSEDEIACNFRKMLTLEQYHYSLQRKLRPIGRWNLLLHE